MGLYGTVELRSKICLFGVCVLFFFFSWGVGGKFVLVVLERIGSLVGLLLVEGSMGMGWWFEGDGGAWERFCGGKCEGRVGVVVGLVWAVKFSEWTRHQKMRCLVDLGSVILLKIQS